MSQPQPSILAPVPAAARYVVLGLDPGANARALLDELAKLPIDASVAVGIGAPLVRALGKSVEGLRPFPALDGAGVSVPSTQGALFFFFRGEDHGGVLNHARRTIASLEGTRIDEDVSAYKHSIGRDLTGYEDGTENPKDERAVEAAIARGGPGIAGGSFVATQRWVHELSRLERLAPAERDAIVGRNRETNEELEDAPESAHVKRSAQESFEPEAFMVRRSMPFGSLAEHGLYFVAYGKTLDAYERVLRRMVGLDDGIVDGLFRFSRPVSGGYYFCPPVAGGKLDLRAL